MTQGGTRDAKAAGEVHPVIVGSTNTAFVAAWPASPAWSLLSGGEIGNTDVVKNAATLRSAVPAPVAGTRGGLSPSRSIAPGDESIIPSGDGSLTATGDDSGTAARLRDTTRDRITRLLLERGWATAVELAAELGLSTAGIRRHLDAMFAEGLVVGREQPTGRPRGRGRPARAFSLTEEARLRCAPHTYDDLATAALRWIARSGGEQAVSAFAAELVGRLEDRCRTAMADATDAPLGRADALAQALSEEGYAANASIIASGGQLCQHHCPVAHVAAEFPQLCEAETQVISRLVGTHVQRLATIANGDGVCTTHIPDPRRFAGAQQADDRPARPAAAPTREHANDREQAIDREQTYIDPVRTR